MNWSENAPALAPGQPPDSDADALFSGDSGTLALDTRRVLVQLLVGPALDGQRHSRLWPILVRDEALIRQRLAELFLELVIDLEMQVAFTRQVMADDLDIPILLRRAQLTLIDSVLLLHLRQRLTQADTQGERAVVAMDEIIEFLDLYVRATSTDHAGFKKRVHAAVEKFKKSSILRKLRSSEDRFEISPTLKLLFSAEEIQALTQVYQHLTETDVSACAVASDFDEEDTEP